MNEAHYDLRAGVARADITPPVGLRLNGTLREDVAHSVDQPLTLTSLVLGAGDKTVCIIAIDAILMSPEEATMLRDTVAKRLGCARTDVFVNVSHSHATPSPPSWREFDGVDEADQAALAATYHALIVAHAASTAEQARSSGRAAYVSAGVGESRIGVNRRESLPDGTVVLGENLDGVTDPTVRVVRIDASEGEPVAAIMHYACHPDVLGPKSDLISPDYVGAARDVAEAIIGAPVLFLQGCAGDIDPSCGIVVGDDGPREARRLGTDLGCEAARVHNSIGDGRTRDQRVLWSSSTDTKSAVTGWIYRDKERSPQSIRAVAKVAQLPLGPFPSLAEAEEMVEQARRKFEHATASGLPLPDILRSRRRKMWTELQLQAIQSGDDPVVDVELSVVAVGDIALVAIPGEIFVEIGLDIIAASPYADTLVCGYTNGVHFYVPTCTAFEQGGYEIDSHQNYLRMAGPTPEWQEILAREFSDLLAMTVDDRQTNDRRSDA